MDDSLANKMKKKERKMETAMRLVTESKTEPHRYGEYYGVHSFFKRMAGLVMIQAWTEPEFPGGKIFVLDITPCSGALI